MDILKFILNSRHFHQQTTTNDVHPKFHNLCLRILNFSDCLNLQNPMDKRLSSVYLTLIIVAVGSSNHGSAAAVSSLRTTQEDNLRIGSSNHGSAAAVSSLRTTPEDNLRIGSSNHGSAAAVSSLRTTPEDNLRMRNGAAFKISLFADLHFGEDAWTEWGPQQDIKSAGVMSAVLANEQPGITLERARGMLL